VSEGTGWAGRLRRLQLPRQQVGGAILILAGFVLLGLGS
jgi:hypothetical protein